MEHSIGDDDDFPFHDFSPQQQRIFDRPSETSTKYGVMLALFCIAVIQFRGTIMGWVDEWRQHSVMEVLWGLWEATWAHLYALQDMMRFLVPHLDEDDDNHAIMTPRRLQAMPDLQEMDVGTAETRGPNDRLTTMGELEPAFLRIEDYPPGWMVYDREAGGVILKVEADELTKKRQQLEHQRDETKLKTSETDECTSDSIVASPVCDSKPLIPSHEVVESQTVSESLTKARHVAMEEAATGMELKPEASAAPRESVVTCRADLNPPADQSPPIAAT